VEEGAWHGRWLVANDLEMSCAGGPFRFARAFDRRLPMSYSPVPVESSRYVNRTLSARDCTVATTLASFATCVGIRRAARPDG
jgi:hypothetical protein